MTFSVAIRPVCASLVAVFATGCSMVDNDPNRFQAMGEQIAAIPVDGGNFSPRRVLSAQQEGLRPALTVEVLDPHAFWDARDGGLRSAIETATVVGGEASAMVDTVSDRLPDIAPQRLGLADGVTPEASGEMTTIQIGAYSSQALASAAWQRLSEGSARAALAGYSPVFEPVVVGGKSLVRLKVGPASAEAASEICRAAQVSDPWCLRRG